jgi:hypothetical protein
LDNDPEQAGVALLLNLGQGDNGCSHPNCDSYFDQEADDDALK